MNRKTRRGEGLRRMLDERRRELRDEVESRLRSVRSDHPDNGRDELDVSDAATRRDLEQALLQMQAETLGRIDEALVRFDEGDYGTCVACGGEIAERRLRALPFAIRCRACEQAREEESGRARVLTRQTDPLGNYLGTTRS